MIVIKRGGIEENFDLHKLTHFLSSMAMLAPRLYSIDKGKLNKTLSGGLADKMTSDEMLVYISEACASMGTRSHSYSILSGRVEAIRLQRNTPSSFKEAMLRAKELLSDEFLAKIEAYDYDQHILHRNDFSYDILAMRTLERSYLLRDSRGFVERPQYMLMRVAVFISDSAEEAVETYQAMSAGIYTHASPTLFNSGLKKHQLASCFLLTMKDDSIAGIYETLKDAALISKGAGGLGISVSNIRANGSRITGTNGTSNGLVPCLRVFNNTARYCDQGGRRKGSFAIFIEPWHADILDVLELKLNHGDENARARDLFYSLWVPDLFMKRVENDQQWSLFCPNDVKGLEAKGFQDLFGEAFEQAYILAENSNLARCVMPARELWDKIISTQQETGTPYLMYKDAVNRCNMQRQLGTIRSSNLCAEVCLYSSREETAVCILSSIALPKFVGIDGVDYDRLVEAVMLVTKNLNHVVDKTSYPVEAARSNERHRPIGIGVQGLSDVFQMLGVPHDSEDARRTNMLIFESIYYAAVRASVDLAKKDGPYDSFAGSPASQGLFNFDLWQHTPSQRYDWESLRADMVQHGMRNSVLTACMPTASSASILGNTESFEPRTSNMYTRRVLSGEFIVLNKYLEAACRKRNLWTPILVDQIMRDRGSVQKTNLPDDLKAVFKTVWEMSQKPLIDMSRARAPYICQSQSLNLYQAAPTRNSLASMHFYAWKQGLKTGIYYLRTQPRANAIAFTAKEDCISCQA